MSKNYAVSGPSASGTGPKTAVGITATAAIRPAIYDVSVGSSSTPADNTFQFTLGRFTAVGTSTAATPEPLDSSDLPAISIGGITHSAEPTYTAGKSLLDVSLNQRATFRWVAAPGS